MCENSVLRISTMDFPEGANLEEVARVNCIGPWKTLAKGECDDVRSKTAILKDDVRGSD